MAIGPQFTPALRLLERCEVGEVETLLICACMVTAVDDFGEPWKAAQPERDATAITKRLGRRTTSQTAGTTASGSPGQRCQGRKSARQAAKQLRSS
jgi:hypothetical protein